MAVEISVIIPTHNRADLLPETVASILNQHHPAAEIIVVDDGSTDGTEAVARLFPPVVKYVRLEKVGQHRTRNFGVSLATTPWVAYCDSDDVWQPDKLAAQARLLQALPDVKFAFTNFRIISGGAWSSGTKFDDAPEGYWDLPTRQIEAGGFVVDAPMFTKLLAFQPVFPSTVVVSRDFLLKSGGWSERMGSALSVDLELFLRCVAESPIGIHSTPLVGIRKHEGNISANFLRTLEGQIQVLHFVLANHPFAARYVPEILDSIAERATTGADLAFAMGNLEAVRRLLTDVPSRQRSWKLQIKAAIAHLPTPVAKVLQNSAVTLAAKETTSSDA